ncbi:hypothetical protein NDU88_003668 [Pleurodeles waltl]|uniref:Secreted protein n=1 Tax=Pleurodeles waltl TaxID=8319 RepID=A0AAV7QG97_PLEWA|nr:hypothetical protein NDU88_003668 [Pleurodeles waltl]
MSQASGLSTCGLVLAWIQLARFRLVGWSFNALQYAVSGAVGRGSERNRAASGSRSGLGPLLMSPLPSCGSARLSADQRGSGATATESH